VRRASDVCRATGASAIVFFDRAPRRALPEQERVSVRVAGPGECADDLIRAFLDGERAAADATVVSSDKPLYSYGRTRGAAVLRAHEWSALERSAGTRS
jgi:hypothetical protein